MKYEVILIIAFFTILRSYTDAYPRPINCRFVCPKNSIYLPKAPLCGHCGPVVTNLNDPCQDLKCPGNMKCIELKAPCPENDNECVKCECQNEAAVNCQGNVVTNGYGCSQCNNKM